MLTHALNPHTGLSKEETSGIGAGAKSMAWISELRDPAFASVYFSTFWISCLNTSAALLH